MGTNRRILFLADINSVHTEKWARSLVSRGYEIGVFSLAAKQTIWADDLNIYYHCFDISQDEIKGGSRFAKSSYFKAIRELRPLIDSFIPDIVHAHYASSYGMLATKLKFPYTVISLWGSDIYEFPKRSLIHRRLIKRILKKAPVVCSTSLAMAAEAKKYVDREYAITPFGVNVSYFENERKINDVFTIGTVKSLEHIYGIDRLIYAYAEYRNSSNGDSHLKIYGKGSELKNLLELVDELQLTDCVSFEGFVSGDDLIKAFNSLDVYVALSRQESFGVAVLEAQSCGVPVIVTNIGGLPEVVDVNSGFVVDNEVVHEAAIKMKELEGATDGKNRSESARQFVIDNFSDEACVDKLIKVYDQLK